MSTEDLNKENFDYCILGSNLTENILGAALGIAGKKCLFLDQADRYGSSLSSYNLEQYLRFGKVSVAHWTFSIGKDRY
jgi:RAB protein geranylgeranyltransferase component A